ncbi:hypothetical protein GGX14DRAFT_638038 [Mycena pura]|uniref:Uncharacterized protein n=1 Tax=Mycena pura TaxID=153505 RepID=A0AAD6YNV4_9AGAR|nr:hypothetical protein GGX14DRAFT_638038 [Mycena pura]
MMNKPKEMLATTKINYDSDSESESNVDDDHTNSISEETRLLQELDISHREETVVYKPNPFSIAKINAAARSNRVSTPVTNTRPAKPAPKKPTGRIVDCFNTTKAKANKRSSISSSTEATRQRKCFVPELSPESVFLPPNSTTLDADHNPVNNNPDPSVDFPTFQIPPMPQITDSNHEDPAPVAVTRAPPPMTINIAPPVTNFDRPEEALTQPQRNGAILPHTSTLLPHPSQSAFSDFAPTFLPARAPAEVRRTIIPHHGPNNAPPVTNSDRPEEALTQPQHNSAILPHTSTFLPRPSQSAFSEKNTFAPTFFSSPFKAKAPAEARRTVIPHQGPNNQSFFSSPLRPVQPTPFPRVSSFAPSGPTAHSLSQMQPSSIHTFFRPKKTIIPKLRPAPCKHSRASAITRDLARGPCAAASATPLPLVQSIQAIHKPAHRAPAIFHEYAEIPSEQINPSIPTLTLENRFQPPLDLPPSSPMAMYSATSTPSPLPRHKHANSRITTTSHRPLKRRKSKDAYNFLRSDPDDEWTTLQARKKGKAAKVGGAKTKGIRTTKAFRMPMLAMPGKTKGNLKTSGMSATSATRVITFLPPPLGVGKVEVQVEELGPATLDAQTPSSTLKRPRGSPGSSPVAKTPKRRRVSENPYPSPANSRLTPGDSVVVTSASSNSASSPSPVRLAARPNCIPSPPTSDPVPECPGGDVQLSVAVERILQGYPKTKVLMRQRKRGSDAMWDLLSLPSCGIVHRDGDGASGQELPVIVWKGQQNVENFGIAT